MVVLRYQERNLFANHRSVKWECYLRLWHENASLAVRGGENDARVNYEIAAKRIP